MAEWVRIPRNVIYTHVVKRAGIHRGAFALVALLRGRDIRRDIWPERFGLRKPTERPSFTPRARNREMEFWGSRSLGPSPRETPSILPTPHRGGGFLPTPGREGGFLPVPGRRNRVL